MLQADNLIALDFILATLYWGAACWRIRANVSNFMAMHTLLILVKWNCAVGVSRAGDKPRCSPAGDICLAAGWARPTISALFASTVFALVEAKAPSTMINWVGFWCRMGHGHCQDESGKRKNSRSEVLECLHGGFWWIDDCWGDVSNWRRGLEVAGVQSNQIIEMKAGQQEELRKKKLIFRTMLDGLSFCSTLTDLHRDDGCKI